jgi:hypothetical protein
VPAVLVLLHGLEDVRVLVGCQPAVLLGAVLALLGDQLALDDLLHLLQVDIADLVGADAPAGDVAEAGVVDLFRNLLLVVLRLLLLQLQGEVLEDHGLVGPSGVVAELAEGVLPGPVLEGVAQVLQHVLELVDGETGVPVLLEDEQEGVLEPAGPLR